MNAGLDPRSTAACGSDSWPLSYAQEQLWFLQYLHPEMTAYNLPRVLRIDGDLDAAALERAFQALTRRHVVLRTRYIERDGRPLAVTDGDGRFVLPLVDLSALPEPQRREALEQEVRGIAGRRFDLQARAPVAASLVRMDAAQHMLLVCLHHIASDAGANPIIIRDLAEAYDQALRTGGPASLPPAPLSYSEFARRQRAAVERGELAASLTAWNAYLGRDIPALNLPTDNVRPEIQSFAGRSLWFDLDPGVHDALLAFCKQERCTPFVALMAAWQALMARYCGQYDFAVGVPNAGRGEEALEELVGSMVNTQVWRARLAPSMTLRQLCRQLRADAMLALEHVGLPFEVLLASREDRRDPGRSKQFQTMFSLQMADAPVTPRLGDARIEAVEYDATGARFDLSLDFRVGRAAARGRLEYNSDLFRADTAQWLADAYMRVLAQIVDCPEARLGALVLDDEATRGHALRLAAPSISADASGETLHGLFAAQAAARGEAIAVVCEGASLSYAELAARASRLARRLARLGVRAETPVGLCVERSLDLIVAMLAILEAGGAYVPLDPQLPQERLAYIAEDSGVALLVTTGALGERFAALPALPVLRLDALDLAQDELAQDEPEQDDEFDRRRASHPGRLAYVIYTSGSTGRPKGAQLSHRNAYSGIALADGHPNG